MKSLKFSGMGMYYNFMIIRMSTSKNKTYPVFIELMLSAVHQRLSLTNLTRSALDKPHGAGYSYFSVRERSAEQGIIFRIVTPRQGIIFVKIGSITGSTFVIFDSERSFTQFAICECDSNRLDGNISTFFDRCFTNFLCKT